VPNAVQVEGLKKHYGDVQALNGVSFNVESGECFGLLGPNGAGKSTLIRLLSTLEVPSEGDCFIAGMQVTSRSAQVRNKIGVALQETGVDPLMTGREVLMLAARLYGYHSAKARRRVHFLLERFDLTAVSTRRVGTYSGGMRRRLDLAAAIVHEPEVIILDEPTTGLDPTNRIALWDLLRSLCHDDHKTIILTTQYLDEADALCDRLLFMNQGQIWASGTPAELKRNMGYSVVHFAVEGERVDRLRDRLAADGLVCRVVRSELEMDSRQPEAEVFRIQQWLHQESLTMSHLEVRPPSLDEVFLHLMNSGPREERVRDEVLA